MKRVPRIVAVLALVIAGSGGTAAVAAAPPPPVPVRPVYLALGDSMATGQNSAAPEDDINAYWRTVDAWKRNGYVTPFSKYLKHEVNCLPETATASDLCGQLDVINLARSAVPPSDGDPGLPGVTSQAVIDEQLAPAEELIALRNGDDNPRNDVKVITLTVGGNEIFDAFRTGDSTIIGNAITTFAGNYTQILMRLRTAAPDVPILTMTYFNPLRYCATGLPPEQVEPVAMQADYVLEYLEVAPGVYGFNGVITSISSAFGAVPADTYGQLGAGDFFDCKHPNKAGYQDVLAAFEAAWQQTGQ